MAINIFECFECGESIKDKFDEKLMFWCDQECHFRYLERIKKEAEVSSEWSDYMAGTGPLPKGKHPKAFTPTARQSKKARKPQIKGARKLTGERPYETIEIMKVKDQLTGEQLPRIRSLTEGNVGKYRCKKCGNFGHNIRTCSK